MPLPDLPPYPVQIQAMAGHSELLRETGQRMAQAINENPDYTPDETLHLTIAHYQLTKRETVQAIHTACEETRRILMPLPVRIKEKAGTYPSVTHPGHQCLWLLAGPEEEQMDALLKILEKAASAHENILKNRITPHLRLGLLRMNSAEARQKQAICEDFAKSLNSVEWTINQVRPMTRRNLHDPWHPVSP